MQGKEPVKLRMSGKKRYFFKNMRFRSIQSDIAVTFSCLILLTALFIALISYSLWSDSVESNSRDYTLQLIGQVNTNIESYVSYMENISQMVVDNYDVNDYLTRPEFANTNEEQDLELKIYGQFDSILNVRKDISNIIIFGSNGRVILNKNNLNLNPYVRPQDQSWYKEAIKADGNPVISSSHVQNIVQGDYRWVVSLSRELKSPDGTKDLGVLLVDLNYSVINDICSKVNLGKRGYIFIVDDQGNIIYHPQQQLIYSNLKTEMIDQVMNTKSSYFITNEGNDSRMYTVANSEPTGWKIVGVAYMNELEANKPLMQTFYILGTFGLVILAILMSLIISSRISKPIKLLELSMKEVERGNFEKKVDVQSSNEIGELGKAFNIMTAEIKELMHQIVHEQELKRKSELRALQSQDQPSFFCTTPLTLSSGWARAKNPRRLSS